MYVYFCPEVLSRNSIQEGINYGLEMKKYFCQKNAKYKLFPTDINQS